MSTRLSSGRSNQQGYSSRNAGMSSFAGNSSGSSSNASHVMNNMSVAQVRELYARALSEAEAKRTELKLVVTSRYNELVGSSDEVQTMQQCAKELFEKVSILPILLEKVNACNEEALQVARKLPLLPPSNNSFSPSMTSQHDLLSGSTSKKSLVQIIRHRAQTEPNLVLFLRRRLEVLTGRIHRALDKKDPHLAALAIVEAMSWIAIHDFVVNGGSASTIRYPLARLISLVDPQEFQHYLLPPTTRKDDTAATTNNNNTDPQLVQKQEQYSFLVTQIRLTYLQIQCLPLKTIRVAQTVLKTPATNTAQKAGALSTLPLLDPTFRTTDASSSKLLDLYFDSKSNLLSNLLDALEVHHNTTHNARAHLDEDDNSILQKLVQQLQTIVLVLQQDLVLHTHKIFLHMLPSSSSGIAYDTHSHDTANSSSTLAATSVVPGGIDIDFDPKMVKAKCSRFLAAHLPMIANRLRNILSSVNTATHLATIRQALYQQTNTDLDHEQWNQAVQEIIDLRVVLHAKNSSSSGETNSSTTNSLISAAATTTPRSWIAPSDGQQSSSPPLSFSLWSILFSQTFDSLVENLLRQSCMSLHNTLISTLRRSIALAPSPSTRIKPHEAYRNCQTIVSTLDATLARLADDAWKLVHSEERHVSSVALRQSLYTQTCEAMARLLCELRLLVSSTSNYNGIKDLVLSTSSSENDTFGDSNTTTAQQKQEQEGNNNDASRDAVKELIVARLCFLLKYRLKSLQTLLNPTSAPWFDSSLVSRQHMITFEELQSAFEIADDDDDGILSLPEASEALETAFSGSNFDGVYIISSLKYEMNPSNVPANVTLSELTLLTARGIKYESTKSSSDARLRDLQGTTKTPSIKKNHALRTIQTCLDSILVSCWTSWSKIVLAPAAQELKSGCNLFCQNWHVSGSEWLRLHEGGDYYPVMTSSEQQHVRVPSSISSYLMAYLLAASMEFHRVICPRDFLPPVESLQEAEELGIAIASTAKEQDLPPTLVVLIRQALLRHALKTFHWVFTSERTGSASAMKECSDPCLLQILVDVHFFQHCMGRCATLLQDHESMDLLEQLQRVAIDVAVCLTSRMDVDIIREKIDTMLCPALYSSCVLFLASLLGEDEKGQSSKLSDGVLGLSSDYDIGVGGSTLAPLASSRRFVLLPIQSERQLNEIALQASRNAGQRSALNENAKIGDLKSGVASSSFGFFTSMKASWKK